MGPSFQAPWWLRGPHAQTVWSYLVQRVPKVAWRRERVETPDNDFVDLDWVDGPAEAPLVIACHGLEGSSSAPYMRRLMSAVKMRCWRGVVIHCRGCSGEDNRRVQAYHAGFVADLVTLFPDLANRGTGPLFAVGYSLGGAQLARYLGEHAASVPPALRAAFTVSSPMTLEVGAEALKRGFNRVYTYKFLRTLRKKADGKTLLDPAQKERAAASRRARTLEAFDDVWTAPVNGFADVADYYARAAAGPWLRKVQLPLRLLIAKDDPIVPAANLRPEHLEGASAVSVDWTERGGHVGFVCDGDPHWLEGRILDWFDAHLPSSATEEQTRLTG